MTSIVFPDKLVNTSPGFVALPPGMFSVAGMNPIIFRGRRIWAAVRNAASTTAPPVISAFM
jgi:hypothetical protein